MSNPLLKALKDKIPGSTYRLPSGGMQYNSGVLSDDVVNGEVHIFPMTGLEEIFMKTPDMLLSGKAIEATFNKCIPQILNASKLFVKDVDYLLTALKIVTYGNVQEINYEHDCGEAKSHKYEIDIAPLLSNVKQIDPTSIDKKFTIKNEVGQKITLQPQIFSDWLKIYDIATKPKQPNIDAFEAAKETNDFLISIISDVIADVDGITDKQQIGEWINAMSAKMRDNLRDKIVELNDWGIDPFVKIKCKDCNEEMNIEIPINPVSFFIES